MIGLTQHYQLPTRLLNLTANPLVVLYFCVEKDYTQESLKKLRNIYSFRFF
ncbi:FRG domain-containing protein [Companilactobacillus farciminis]|uniref:FRG domain-containing protein n=1 Tax=Companilactobacillus farciminis TaxID=1612 RepID=UPI001916B02A